MPMPQERIRPKYLFDQERIEQLKTIVPEAFADGKINWEVLHEALGEYLESETPETEHFGLSWPGKREARRLTSIPSTGTLVPCEGEGVNEEKTHNIFIEGDNFEVLKLLQKSYAGQIKMIYIDPPYNTGNDFIYRDKYSETLKTYLAYAGLVDDEGRKFSTNNPNEGRFHTKWLNMMYPRLYLARNLLREDGVIFISIDDNEFSNLRKMCDDIFGEENLIGTVVWNSTKSVTNTALISVSHTYNLIYAKEIDYFTKNRNHFRLPEDGEGFSNPDNDSRGPWKADPFQVGGWRPNQQYEIVNPKTGEIYKPNPSCSWKNDYKKYLELLEDNRIVFGVSGEAGPQRKRFQTEAEERGRVAKTWWDDVSTTTNATQSLRKLFDDKSTFPNPKPVDLIKKMVQLGDHTKTGIILDFFAGSCTTAHAIIDLNGRDNGTRHFIMVQLPELIPEGHPARHAGYNTISEIGKERIRKAIANINDNSKSDPKSAYESEDLGFKVFKLQHSNLKWR
jgi:adenine-specific DNA-methyltransferase